MVFEILRPHRYSRITRRDMREVYKRRSCRAAVVYERQIGAFVLGRSYSLTAPSVRVFNRRMRDFSDYLREALR